MKNNMKKDRREKTVHLRLFNQEKSMLDTIGRIIWEEQSRGGRVVDVDVMRWLIIEEHKRRFPHGE